MTKSEPEPARPASDIMLDPWLTLGAACMAKAVHDFRSKDILDALDALLWFLSDDVLFWLDGLGLPCTDHDVVFWRLGRSRNGKK